MLYKYPQVAFPYADLVEESSRRSSHDPEYELFDAIGRAFREHRYFDVFVEYAKQDAEDILCRIRVINRGPDPAPIHVLPHLWYRNTWSWTSDGHRHVIWADVDDSVCTSDPALGERWWYVEAEDGSKPELLFTENDTNVERLFGVPNPSPHVKDAINDAVVLGQRDRVSDSRGTKVAAQLRAIVEPGGSFTVRVRLARQSGARPFEQFDATIAQRLAEANEFYASVHAAHLNEDERLVQRQAFAGLLWSKQFYHFDVHHWLTGDPAQPAPPRERWNGRNRDWAFHLYNAEIVLMPDKWEYPWYASWDLAFQAVVMAEIDPAFAKKQMLFLTSPRSQHPYGSIPAFEWDFSAVNPPVIAWAVWQIYHLDRVQRGEGDVAFLESMFGSLVMMLGWWLNRKDSEGKGIFSGGFLGLDNIGIFDRDRPLPTGGSLEQGDATGWMAMFQLNMVDIAVELACRDLRYGPMAQRFGQDFVMIASVLQQTGEGGMGLWSEEDRFYFDVIRHDAGRLPLKIYSMVGLVPLFATSITHQATLMRLPNLLRITGDVISTRPYLKTILPSFVEPGRDGARLLSLTNRDRLTSILRRVLDETQFLSDYGVRSLSREHAQRPYQFFVGGEAYEVSYLPGVSDNRVFGGNSNWRGPIWFPMNFLLIQAIATFGCYYDGGFTMECPTGSGKYLTLPEIADELARRLTRIFVRDEASGPRVVFGDNEHFQDDMHWRDHVPFYEFFHGDSGVGLGASHQTGWTALVALLLQYRGDLCLSRRRSVESTESSAAPARRSSPESSTADAGEALEVMP